MAESVRVLITDGMAENGVNALKSAGNFEIDLRKETPKEELASIIGNYDCIVIRSATTLTPDLIEKATSMKLIVRAGAGVDNIDVPTATSKKIPVMNTATANSLAAAELTIGMMFAMLRHIPQAHMSMKSKEWNRSAFKGYEVTGKILGVVGLGNIGRIVAEKAIGLGMNVVAYDPVAKQDASFAKAAESMTLVSTPDEVFEKCDILTLHVPKSDQTKNLINADRLKKMKKGSFLINCARGGTADEKAVLAALEDGTLTAAAFDVFEKEPVEFPNALAEHPRVVVTPHIGAQTFEAQTRVATTAATQMINFFEKGDRTGVIN